MNDHTTPSIPWGESWYWRLHRKLTPGLRNAQYAYFESLEQSLREGDRWLDVGCGRRLAPGWMRQGKDMERRLIARAGEVVGVDPDLEALSDNTLPIRTIHATAASVPEFDGSFDLITANMVFEHLGDPVSVLRESARLLRPGGRILIHTPNVWYPITLAAACVPARLRTRLTAWLEKRSAKDIYPTRYRMNDAKAVRQAAKQAGLQVVSIQRTADSPEFIVLGPLLVFELGLIALTRTRACKALASNLIITLAKPHAADCENDAVARQRQAQATLMKDAA